MQQLYTLYTDHCHSAPANDAFKVHRSAAKMTYRLKQTHLSLHANVKCQIFFDQKLSSPTSPDFWVQLITAPALLTYRYTTATIHPLPLHCTLHTFNGPFSGTTQVSRYQKGKTNLDFTEARDSEWQWHQLGHMQICTSLHTDNHAGTPPHRFLQAGCPSCRPTNSIKALKALPLH